MITEVEKLPWRISRRYFWPWFVGYAYGKLRTDPVYGEVFRRINDCPLPLLDIGCGMGLLAFYLRERGFTPPITGLDVDEQKIRRGMFIAHRYYPGVELKIGDCGTLPPFMGNVALLDVLHYVSHPEQLRLIREMAARIAPGGWCVIRTSPPDKGLRFCCTLAIEGLARGLLWMTRNAVAFPRLEQIAAQFPEEAFARDIRPLWGRTPFNSWLLAFQRRS